MPLADKTSAELKALCKERGLKVGGKKAELIERLEEAAGSPVGEEKSVEGESTEKEDEKSVEGEPTGKNDEIPGPKDWRHIEGASFPENSFTENATHRPSPWGPVIKPVWEGMEFADPQGKMLDGSGYMCLDGIVRKGDPYSVNQTEDFYSWLTEWVVAARTGQLKDDDPQANKAYMEQGKPKQGRSMEQTQKTKDKATTKKR